MRKIRTLGVVALIAGFLLPLDAAYGKRSRRDGFNFGSGVRILSGNDKTNSVDENTKNTIDSSQEVFAPYIGYSFNGTLNLGISFENSNVLRDEKFIDHNGLEIEKSNRRNTKSASIFTRFLFGELFFLELGGGLYQETEEIKTTTYIIALNGTFTGGTETQKFEGVGQGYHMGAGFEVPTGAGFYFTGSYTARIYQIREGDGVFSRGNRRSYQQQRTLLFGLAHYYN